MGAHGLPTHEEFERDVWARMRAAEYTAKELTIANQRLREKLAATREQLDMTRERLHEALQKIGEY